MKLLKILLLVGFSLLSCTAEEKETVETQKQAKEKIAFWDKQQKGTNYFNKTPAEEWFDAANKANIKFVRFVYDKWQGEQEYFLIGNADNYKGIVEQDFKKLKQYLDYANALDIKVVLCPISIPGEKWRQANNNQNDGRLWKEERYINQVIRFWKDVAIRLQEHPAIVGYNLVNEPHPEIYSKKYSFWAGDLADWYETVKNTPADLNLFNKRLVEAIRSVDKATPIIVESGLYATPWAFDYLQPLENDKIIYSFHMYEPYTFTTKRINNGRHAYPGQIPIEETGAIFELNKEGLNKFFEPVRAWSQKHDIPSNRIWVGEFGCNRYIEGVESYLEDLISIFNAEHWHWSFYSYREDVWEAMDYELGTAKVFYKYWDYQEANTLHLHFDEVYGRVKDKRLWEVIQKEFE